MGSNCLRRPTGRRGARPNTHTEQSHDDAIARGAPWQRAAPLVGVLLLAAAGDLHLIEDASGAVLC